MLTRDETIIEGLRRGDEAVFAQLVREYQPLMLRVAKGYVRTQTAAEEVVQDTWLGVLRGIERFEGRSSLKTWIFRILVNRAKTRGVRDARSQPFSSLDGGEDGPTVDPSRFERSGDWSGWWRTYPIDPRTLPEERLLARETMAVVRDAIAELPERQQEVILLRDVVGLDAAEAAHALDVSEGNQRVLLHRARAKVRAALERELEADAA